MFLIDEICQSGGAERALLKIARLLPRDRFQPQIVTFRFDPNLDIVRELPCSLRAFPLRRTYDVGALSVALRLAALLRVERIDVVHTFFETSDLWAGPIARFSGVPVLISSRRDMGILRTRKHQLAYRVIGRLFDQTQTVSEMVRQKVIATDRLRPSQVVTIYNGVDLERIDAVPVSGSVRATRDLEINGASHVITSVGNIRRVKGYDILIRAAALVRRRFPTAVFVVAGENYEREHYGELLELRRELGLVDAVRFVGGVSDPIPLLKASDVFCLPSRSEGLSNALLEAMACGLPVVATRVGGNSEVIEHGCSGYLVESEDACALSDNIIHLLTNANRRTEMARIARRTVEQRFSDQRMISALIAEYEKLLTAE